MRHLGSFKAGSSLLGIEGGGVMRIENLAVQLLLRASIVVALVLISFAHKPTALSPPQPDDLSAYMLPDGSLPVICFASDGTEKENEAGYANVCEFCQIAGSFALAEPGRSDKPAFDPELQPLFPAETKHVFSLPWRLLPPKQGPPSIVV